MNFYFSLIYFVLVCLANAIKSNESKIKEYHLVKEHKKFAIIFIQAMDLELIDKGKFVNYPLYKIEDYKVKTTSRIDHFWKFCAKILKEFDLKLEIESSEVIFTSFYYKILRWLNHHLSFVQGYKVINPEVTGAIQKIMAERKFDEDIKIVFNEKIYDITIPKQLTVFDKEIDFAIQLIYEVELQNAEAFRGNFEDGKEMFRQIVCCHHIRCKNIEVYEDFFQKLDNYEEDYSNYELSRRKLQSIGLIDITMITFRGGYKQEIDYNSINLNDSVRGTVSHFKDVALLFLEAVESRVFRLKKIDNVMYAFVKSFLENFSTRNEAFNLRICSLNLRVYHLVYVFKESYYTYSNDLKNTEASVTFFRLLKWLLKYSKFQACFFAEEGINETLLMIQRERPVPNDVVNLNTRIPRGITNLRQLVEFATTEGNTERTLVEEDDFIVPRAPLPLKKLFKNQPNIESKEDEPETMNVIRKKLWRVSPEEVKNEAETMEIMDGSVPVPLNQTTNPEKPGKSKSSTSFIGNCFESIGSLIKPPLRCIKNTMAKALVCFKG